MQSDVFKKLRELQEILSKKYEIQADIEDLPKALATKSELLSRMKQAYVDKNNDFLAVTQKIKELRQKMNEAERLREKYEGQMDQIQTQREYEALDKEIKDSADKELQYRHDLQREEAHLNDMKMSLEKDELMIEKQEEEVKNEQLKIKSDIDGKKKLLTELEKEESKITPDLDEEILFKFERIIKSKSGLGIVPIHDQVCTGCHMQLPPQFVNDVRKGESIMFCPYCSRILYYEDIDGEEENIKVG